MLLAGALCRRFGSPRMTVISCALLSATLVLPALASSAITLGLAAGRLRRRLRLPQRGHEQRRGRHRGRTAAPGDAGLPRRVELRRPGRSRPSAACSRRTCPRCGTCCSSRWPACSVSAVAGHTLLTRASFLRQAATASADRTAQRPHASGGRARPGVARGAADRTHGRAVRPDRAVRRLRRGRHRRLGRAASQAGSRRERGPGRRGLRGLRAGRGERAAVRYRAARAARPHAACWCWAA